MVFKKYLMKLAPFILTIVIAIILVGCSPNGSEQLQQQQQKDYYQQQMEEELQRSYRQEQVNENLGRPEQAGIFLKALGEQCRHEIDLLFKASKSTANGFRSTCDGGVDFCFGKTEELSTQLDVEGLKLLELCGDLNDELLDKGQFTDEDITDLHGELSRELSTKAKEGRARLIGFYGTSSSKLTTTSKVTKVIDGDTIKLSSGEEVRLMGLNAPESGQSCSLESTNKLKDFVLGKEIILEQDIDKKDQYDRLLRYVYVDDIFVNLEMVRFGFAHKYEYGSNTKYSSQFEQAENEAKQNEGCLWKTSQENYIINQCIYITNFHFNAGGDDNYNLNDEYVIFGNKCSYSIAMPGWTIKDETASHIYTIPQFMFQASSTFTLFTGTGANTNSALYWGRTSGDYAAIWNNKGDTLFLRDSNGNLVLSQSYSGY